VRFPRVNGVWMGGMVFDFRPVHQFQREAEEAGPVEIPAKADPRPETIVNVADVDPVEYKLDRVDARARFIGRALGARRTALNLTELSPGSESAPPHCHSAIEELFVVLDGEGVLTLGNDEQEHPVRAGSLVARRAGTGEAHGFRAGDGGLTFLAYSDVDPNDMVFYPRTGKVLIRGLGITIRPEQVDWQGD
jgi:uncharacterized cupin superfamily protein